MAESLKKGKFTKELETYQAQLPSLLSQTGKFVVICEDKILGTYDTYNDALNAGYKQYGVDAAFLVQRIAPVQTVAFLTRAVTPSCQA